MEKAGPTTDESDWPQGRPENARLRMTRKRFVIKPFLTTLLCGIAPMLRLMGPSWTKTDLPALIFAVFAFWLLTLAFGIMSLVALRVPVTEPLPPGRIEFTLLVGALGLQFTSPVLALLCLLVAGTSSVIQAMERIGMASARAEYLRSEDAAKGIDRADRGLGDTSNASSEIRSSASR